MISIEAIAIDINTVVINSYPTLPITGDDILADTLVREKQRRSSVVQELVFDSFL